MLTKTKPDGTWNVIGTDGKIVPWKDIPSELFGVIYRLRDYECSGLSPYAVSQMQDEFSWLVRKNKDLAVENARLKALVDDLESVLKGKVN